MKQLLAFLLFLAGTSALAQTAPAPASTASVTPLGNDAIHKATDQLATKYLLDGGQIAKVQKIQARKLRSLDEIAPLKNTDPAKYNVKLQNLQRGTLASLRRLLTTEAQLALYQKTQSDVRAKRAEMRKIMLGKGASNDEILAAELAIYAE